MKVAQLCPTLCGPMDYTVHEIHQARILQLGSLSLLQGIFPTQESSWDLLHCKWILYQLNYAILFRPTLEILWVWWQTTKVK